MCVRLAYIERSKNQRNCEHSKWSKWRCVFCSHINRTFNMLSIWFVGAVHNFTYGRTQKKNHLTHTARTHTHSPHGHAKHETQKNAKWNFNDADNRFSELSTSIHSAFRIRTSPLISSTECRFSPIFRSRCRIFSVCIVAPTFKWMSNNKVKHSKRQLTLYVHVM